MSFDEIGKQFTQHYYATSGTNRAALAGIYRPSSLMTWSGEQLQGVDAIMTKFQGLRFSAQFKVEDVDCHPSVSSGVLVVVHGEMIIEGESHSLRFNDVFHLAQENGQWIVTNQIFRILGGGSQ